MNDFGHLNSLHPTAPLFDSFALTATASLRNDVDHLFAPVRKNPNNRHSLPSSG
jgi:hypothetical protein